MEETLLSILVRFDLTYEPCRTFPLGPNPLWRNLKSASSHLAEKPLDEALFLDPVTGEYIGRTTGVVYPADIVCEQLERFPKILSLEEPTFDIWCDQLADLALTGQTCSERGWKKYSYNPDLEIGQTVPGDEFHFEQCVNPSGIQFSVRDDSGQSKFVANCAEIEHKNHPLKESSQFDDAHAIYASDETPQADIFESLAILARLVKSRPNAVHWKWLPILIDFLGNHINISGCGGVCNNIGIPDLLSAFVTLRREKQDLLHLMKVNYDCLVASQQKVKQLRTQLYGHQKH